MIEKAKRLVEHKKDVVICWTPSPVLACTCTVIPSLRQGIDRCVDANAQTDSAAFLRRGPQRRRRQPDHHHHRADRHRLPRWMGSHLRRVLAVPGNMELHLSPRIAEKRACQPDITRSGTRK